MSDHKIFEEDVLDAIWNVQPVSPALPISGGMMRWFTFTAKREPTEEEKAIHRAISVAPDDGKRYGTQQFSEDE